MCRPVAFIAPELFRHIVNSSYQIWITSNSCSKSRMARVAVAQMVRMEASELPESTEWQAEDEIPHARHWYGPLAKESCNRVKGDQGGAGSHVHLNIFSRSYAPYKYNFVAKYDLPCGQTVYKYRRATTSQIILIRDIRGLRLFPEGKRRKTCGHQCKIGRQGAPDIR